jgi:hypothetical protein
LDSSSGETPPYDDLPEGRGIPDDDKDDWMIDDIGI